MKKRGVRLLAVAGVVSLGVLVFSGTVYAEGPGETVSADAGEEAAAAVTVSIEGTRLAAGTPMEVSVTGLSSGDSQLQVQWFVEDALAAEGTAYTPSEADYEHWIRVQAVKDGQVLGSDSRYMSRLPVAYINTDDGQPVTVKEEYKSGWLTIQGNGDYDCQYNGPMQIKGRGNSSWLYPKKPYRLKLGTSTDLFGFGKNKNYVLLSNYMDESLVRNTVAGEIAEELGLVNMQSIWVDVIFNGQYVGNYQLCEHVRVGKDRVPVFSWEDAAEEAAEAIAKGEGGWSEEDQDRLADQMAEDFSWVTSGRVTYGDREYEVGNYYKEKLDISGGYLFESSLEYDELSRFTTANGLYVMLKEPEYLLTNPEMMAYVQKLWNDFESAVRAADGCAPDGRHYTEIADLDSMVRYWLCMEIMGNNDASRKSRYAYQDVGGKLTFGPVWDFDYGAGSSAVGLDASGWKFTRSGSDQNFFRYWVDDPLFAENAVETYHQLRPYLENLIQDGGLLDQHFAYLRESGQANEGIWRYKRGFSGGQGDAALFQRYLRQRIAWLDQQFADSGALARSFR